MKAGVEDGHLRRRRDEMICENQPSKERQTRGEVLGDKRRRHVGRRRRLVARQAVCQEDERRRQRAERTRGGSGVTTGVTRKPAGEQEPTGGEAFADRRRWIIERRENEAARCKDDRGRWMRHDKGDKRQREER
jgi:hypothetical protein